MTMMVWVTTTTHWSAELRMRSRTWKRSLIGVFRREMLQAKSSLPSRDLHNETQHRVDKHMVGLSARVRNNNNHNNNTIWGGSVFNKRGAPTSLRGVEACSLPSGWPYPIPAIPPYVVRTPHLHGAPTAEETSFVKP